MIKHLNILRKAIRDNLVIHKNGTASLKLPHGDWNLLLAILDKLIEHLKSKGGIR